jgi:hypothetical protein
MPGRWLEGVDGIRVYQPSDEEVAAERRALLSRVKETTRRRKQANIAWRAAISNAYDRGLPLRVIADAAGVTHPRVHQIATEPSSAND